MLSVSKRAAALAAFSLFFLAGATEGRAAYFSVSGLLPVANEATANVLEALPVVVEPELGVGFGLSSAIGTTLLPGLRLELEGSFLAFEGTEADISFFGSGTVSELLDSNITVVTWMVNAYYEPPLPMPVKPYIGAGAGFAGIALEVGDGFSSTLDDGEDTVFAMQALAGASLPLAPGSELFGGYRFLLLETAELTDLFGNSVDLDFQSHMLELGVRFGF